MAVDLDNLLDRARFQERRGNAFLDTKNDASGSGNADCCAAELDGFKGVFDLEQTTFGRECAVAVSVLMSSSRSCSRCILDATIYTMISDMSQP